MSGEASPVSSAMMNSASMHMSVNAPRRHVSRPQLSANAAIAASRVVTAGDA